MNVYEVINNRIMELLEQGTIPWRKPWNAEGNMPKNLISKKEYRGINLFLLNAMPFSSPFWLTFKQAQDKGGHVRKGEKSTPVIFWKWIENEEEKDVVLIDTLSYKKIPMLRYYSVFNLDQTEGIAAPEPEEYNDHQPLPGPEQVIKDMPLRPDLRFGGNRACYSPVHDYIQLPNLHTFISPEEYYSTMFHELIHSTGHHSRLGRLQITAPFNFGSHEYSKEELVAEMGAAFLCGYTGTEQKTLENSVAYIKGWLRELKNDQKLLILASSAAQKASDYILNRKGGELEATEDMAA